MKKNIFYTVILLSLLLFFSCAVALQSSTEKLKAESILPPPNANDESLKKLDLLSKNSWIPLLNGKSIPDYPKLIAEPDFLTRFKVSERYDYIQISPVQRTSDKVSVKQVINTVPGKIYQFSITVDSVTSDHGYNGFSTKDSVFVFPGTEYPNLDSSYYVKQVNQFQNARDKITTSIRKVFVATSDKATIEFSVHGNGVFNRNNGFFKTSSFVDLNHAVDESKALIEDLFTDSTHTAIKLSTTQLKINKAKALASEVLNETLKANYLKEITKAQNLLNKVSMTLTVDGLTDDRTTLNSTTIRAKTYPNAFVWFSGHEDIPKGSLESQVEGDGYRYQIRADSNGDIVYKLPEGSYFRGKQEIMIRSALHGKVVVKKQIVEDVSAPFKPIVTSLKDVSNQIEGQAETESTVKVFDSTTNDLIFSGKATRDDQFVIDIPQSQRPLKPYKKYYVTATDSSGNQSERSEILEVQDTLAPEAKPVLQILNIGDGLPPVESLIMDLSDNAGADQVDIEITKQPDLSKPGYTEAILVLRDKAKNQLELTIPFFIKSEDTVDDGKTFLFGQSITVLAIDFPKEKEAQKQFILEHSKASAINMKTLENRTNEINLTFDDNIQQPGIYEATLNIDSLSKKIVLKLSKGKIEIEDFPTDISFGTPTIQSNTTYIPLESNMKMIIKNTQYYQTGWALKSRFKKVLQTEDGIITASDIVFQDNQDIKYMTELADIEIYRQKGPSSERIKEFDFGKNNNQTFLLKMVPGSLLKDKVYTAQIIWTVETGP
ncbi:toxin Cry1Ac domain D-VI-related protein [Enterococcus quebecensis]|uniref:Uncharacterized protein n=1 Tax=Enterococcus quebecensis TaxID=903983 RepID=A0A1E5H317_9ENTE|nr:toxin Cry1Ac domain D-VI-related protein [Enterococcus quebecensis]OEG19306.1 hypothetical protein BCR23_01040 [Enterococcus quebecensis]OJG75779.1 hypothetical protein RV12_GL000118 [Enterococcus quebecensis]